MSFKKILLELIDPNLQFYYNFFLLEFSTIKNEKHLKDKFEEYFVFSQTRENIDSEEKMHVSSQQIKPPQNKIKQSIEDNLMKNSIENNIKESLENNILSPELQEVDSFEDNSKKKNENNEEKEENPKDFVSEEQFFEKDRI